MKFIAWSTNVGTILTPRIMFEVISYNWKRIVKMFTIMSSYYRDVSDGSQDGKNILKESGGIDYSTYLGVSVSKQLYGTV